RRVVLHARGQEALWIRGRGLDRAVRAAGWAAQAVPRALPEGCAARGGDGGRAGTSGGAEALGRSRGRDAALREREDLPELLDGEGRLRWRLQGVEQGRAAGRGQQVREGAGHQPHALLPEREDEAGGDGGSEVRRDQREGLLRHRDAEEDRNVSAVPKR